MIALNLENRKSFILKVLAVFLSFVVLSSLIGIIIYSSTIKNITLVDNDKTIEIRTFKSTVNEILEENNIKLNDKDSIEPSLEKVIDENTKIVIKRAVPIIIQDANTELNVVTNKLTVEEVLKENQIKLEENDKLNVELASKVIKDLVVKITRVTQDTIVEKEQIAYNVSERDTTKISRGFKRVIKQGKNGLKQATYKATYENGELVNKELVAEKVLQKPVHGIVEVGVEPRVKVSRGGTLRYARELVMTATAYTAGYESTGKRPGDWGYGVTASGMIAQKGVVAVDPNVIPLGSKVFVESLDKYQGYGYAIAADTGGAIKGNKIDLFYETVPEALRFGRRKVKVYVLE